MSGTSWLYLNSGMWNDTIGTSPFISFADLGYDVYIGSNRGQLVSNVHSEYAYTSEDFWEFTIDGYAEDVLANMKAAYTSSGNTKGHYYGYSLGTAQMMVALSKYEQDMKDYLEKVILMAPCYTFGEIAAMPLDIDTELKKAGIYAFNGPNFDLDRLCATLSEEYC